MAAVARTVRHLRLRAGSETAVRRMLPVLEDALRCASLGDESGRLFVVRRLALGPLPPDISSQALSRRIEECTLQATRHWVDPSSPAAEAADCVAFAGALQARVQLALRLVRGQVCAAWYWPRAVAEFDTSVEPVENLRRIAWAIAAWPEGRVALPAWVAAVFGAPSDAVLFGACMTVQEGEDLVRRAGLAMVRALRYQEEEFAAGGEPARPSPLSAPLTDNQVPPPRWLEVLWAAAGRAWPAPVRVATPMAERATLALPEAAAHAQEETQPARIDAGARATLPAGAPRTHDEVTALPPVRRPAALRTKPAPQARDTNPARTELPRPLEPPSPSRASLPSHTVHGDPYLAPTACGGLLFLLPVLQRLGLPDRLLPDDDTTAARVLGAALRRLPVPEEDPAWQLVAADKNEHDHAASEAWLAAARAWLRHAGRIGLGPLVLRPALLGLTPTHVDLHFALAQTDLRVRRLGLDLDPGWVPWFGRVVGFHYGGGQP